jgi:dihydroxyacetone kinase-like protein
MITKQQILQWLRNAAAVLAEQKAYLTDLDAAIGDADHGTNIARGFGQVVEKVQPVADKDLGTIFKTTGMTMMSAVGGASGMLYGNFFLKAATVAAGKETLSLDELVAVMAAGVDGIVQRGRAEAGDKTMIDAWGPAVAALYGAAEAGKQPDAALQACVAAAEEGMRATVPMQAKKGRASYLGERSIGHQDPGATSTYFIVAALCDAVVSGSGR